MHAPLWWIAYIWESLENEVRHKVTQLPNTLATTCPWHSYHQGLTTPEAYSWWCLMQSWEYISDVPVTKCTQQSPWGKSLKHCFNEIDILKVEHNTRRLSIYLFSSSSYRRVAKVIEDKNLVWRGHFSLFCVLCGPRDSNPHSLPEWMMETLPFSQLKNLKVWDVFSRRRSP